MSALDTFLLFDAMLIGGLLLEVLGVRFWRVLKHTEDDKRRFTFGKYALLVFLPLVSVIVVAYIAGPITLWVFLASSFLGAVVEVFSGYVVHYIVGERMWTYYHYKIAGGYTSWFSTPMWGLAGVLFWLLGRIFT